MIYSWIRMVIGMRYGYDYKLDPLGVVYDAELEARAKREQMREKNRFELDVRGNGEIRLVDYHTRNYFQMYDLDEAKLICQLLVEQHLKIKELEDALDDLTDNDADVV